MITLLPIRQAHAASNENGAKSRCSMRQTVFFEPSDANLNTNVTFDKLNIPTGARTGLVRREIGPPRTPRGPPRGAECHRFSAPAHPGRITRRGPGCRAANPRGLRHVMVRHYPKPCFELGVVRCGADRCSLAVLTRSTEPAIGMGRIARPEFYGFAATSLQGIGSTELPKNPRSVSENRQPWECQKSLSNNGLTQKPPSAGGESDGIPYSIRLGG
jgi:hypothetical protein